MTELSRNLLAAAREGLAPDPAVAARVRARVAAAVGVSVVAAPAKASAGALKAVGALALLGVVAVALVALPRKIEHPLATPQVIATSVDSDEPRTAVRVATTEPSVAAAAAPIAAPTLRAADATLAREVELIDRAMIALKGGDAPAALEAIASFDRETQHRGQMAEDAAAIAIEAHCLLKHDVRARLAAFERAYPSSAQRARLAAACP